MNHDLLLPEVQRWIRENTFEDTAKLALAKNPFPHIDYKELLEQVASRAKAKQKLPTWFEATNIVFPSKISVEQTSSEKTAQYKSGIVSGHSLIDVTGGFGVDDLYFSQKLRVVHCEINPGLSAIAAHNFEVLGANGIECFAGDGAAILSQLNRRFDWVYVDPSRRNDVKGKVFLLSDCAPDVASLSDFWFSFSDRILVKAAPLLDISAAVKELPNVAKIHVVALENEVKELLFEMHRDFTSEVEVKTVNIVKDSVQKFDFSMHEMNVESHIGRASRYLYEPNASIYKSGAFDLIANRFGLSKLHKNTHLYTSDELVRDFPGRIFSIEAMFKYDKKEMKTHLQNKKANVSVRNFPETVENLRKKWKISDGGDRYSFFTTAFPNDKIVLLCAKI